ncbi:hypothetical protein G9A89_014240 [Geosiphon pyriformis]|nr:hypothetical protein G9A89_014240 [Geosiphon pyriformis]
MPSETNIVDSSIAAFVARIYTHPLDTIRVRIQTTPKSTNTTITKLIPTFSLPNLYRGFPVAAFFSMPAVSTYLYCYDFSKNYFAERFNIPQDRLVNHMLSGTVAEIISGLFWTPMEVLKSKMQCNYVPDTFQEPKERVFRHPTNNFTGPPLVVGHIPRPTGNTLHLAKEIWRTEGLPGFFRGYWMSLGVFIPHTVIYFVIYEKCKSWATKRGIQGTRPKDDPKTPPDVYAPIAPFPFINYLIYSAVASSIAASVSNVLDVVKTRYQVSFKEEKGKSPQEIIRYMYHNEGGFKAFTRGMLARVVWAVPAASISMAIYETLKDQRRRKAFAAAAANQNRNENQNIDELI